MYKMFQFLVMVITIAWLIYERMVWLIHYRNVWPFIRVRIGYPKRGYPRVIPKPTLWVWNWVRLDLGSAWFIHNRNNNDQSMDDSGVQLCQNRFSTIEFCRQFHWFFQPCGDQHYQKPFGDESNSCNHKQQVYGGGRDDG